MWTQNRPFWFLFCIRKLSVKSWSSLCTTLTAGRRIPPHQGIQGVDPKAFCEVQTASACWSTGRSAGLVDNTWQSVVTQEHQLGFWITAKMFHYLPPLFLRPGGNAELQSSLSKNEILLARVLASARLKHLLVYTPPTPAWLAWGGPVNSTTLPHNGATLVQVQTARRWRESGCRIRVGPCWGRRTFQLRRAQATVTCRCVSKAGGLRSRNHKNNT